MKLMGVLDLPLETMSIIGTASKGHAVPSLYPRLFQTGTPSWILNDDVDEPLYTVMMVECYNLRKFPYTNYH